jgi:hypothetical protein
VQLPNVTEDELFKILETTTPTQYDELLSIRNGKRIWRILSEARVGDIAEIEIARRQAYEAEQGKRRAEVAREGTNKVIWVGDLSKPPLGFARRK